MAQLLALALLLAACDANISPVPDATGADAALPWPDTVDPSAEKLVPARTLFDPEGLHQIRIDMAPAAWEAMKANAKDPKLPRTYHQASVNIDGKEWAKVAVRNFGDGSQQAHPAKPNVRIKFNLYDPKGDGPAKVNNLRLKASGEDPSFMREPISYDALRAAGVPAPRYSFARVVIQGQEYGLYQVFEQVDKRFFLWHFGDKHGANYDPKVGCLGFNCPKGGCAALAKSYEQQSDPATHKGSFKPIQAVAVAAADPKVSAAAFRAVLEANVDVDALLKIYAFEVFVAETDGFLRSGQNFEFYVDPKSGKLHIIRSGTDTTYYEAGYVTFADPWAEKNPCKTRREVVYERIQADPVLLARYKDTLQELRCTHFALEHTALKLQLMIPKLKHGMATEVEALSGRVPANVTGFVDGVITWLQKRHWKADEVFGPCPAAR